MNLDEAIVHGISAGFTAILLYALFVLVIGIGILVGIIALITWVVKRIWQGSENPKRTPRSERRSGDWLTDAQRRQQARYEYSDPPLSGKRSRDNQEPKWYPTGWVYNETTGKWDPPDYLGEESKKKWRWDAEKGIWIDREKEERLERYRKNREGKPMNYDEWKAAKLAEQAKKDDPQT